MSEASTGAEVQKSHGVDCAVSVDAWCKHINSNVGSHKENFSKVKRHSQPLSSLLSHGEWEEVHKTTV